MAATPGDMNRDLTDVTFLSNNIKLLQEALDKIKRVLEESETHLERISEASRRRASATAASAAGAAAAFPRHRDIMSSREAAVARPAPSTTAEVRIICSSRDVMYHLSGSGTPMPVLTHGKLTIIRYREGDLFFASEHVFRFTDGRGSVELTLPKGEKHIFAYSFLEADSRRETTLASPPDAFVSGELCAVVPEVIGGKWGSKFGPGCFRVYTLDLR